MYTKRVTERETMKISDHNCAKKKKNMKKAVKEKSLKTTSRSMAMPRGQQSEDTKVCQYAKQEIPLCLHHKSRTDNAKQDIPLCLHH